MDQESQHQSFKLTHPGLATGWSIVIILIVGLLGIGVGYLYGSNLAPEPAATPAVSTPAVQKTPVATKIPTLKPAATATAGLTATPQTTNTPATTPAKTPTSTVTN